MDNHNLASINEKENKTIPNSTTSQADINDSIYIAIEKYLSLIMLEFQEHLGKYKNLYGNVLRFIIYSLDVHKY